MTHFSKRGPLRVGLDFHNLSTRTDKTVRTGIQQVTFELLRAQLLTRERLKGLGVQVIPLPVLPSDQIQGSRFPNCYSSQVNNSRVVLHEAKVELGVPEGELWQGFVNADEHEIPRDIRKRFFEVGKTLDWFVTVGLCEFRPAVEALLAINPKLKVASLLHDLVPQFLPETTDTGLAHWFKNCAMTSIAEFADVVLANSRCTAIDAIEHLTGLPASAQVISTPLPGETLGSSPEAKDPSVLKDFGLTQGGYFVAVGTIEPRKNLAAAVKGFAKYRELLRNGLGSEVAAQKLVLIGKKGWNEAFGSIKPEMDRLGDAVVFTGYRDHGELQTLIAHACALVTTSRYEGYGLPVSAAWQMGVSVITGQNSSLPEAGRMRNIFCDVWSPSSVAAAYFEANRRLSQRNSAQKHVVRPYPQTTWNQLLEDWALSLKEQSSNFKPLRSLTPHYRKRRKPKFLLDVHNLSIHPTELKKTGIQEVTHAMLLAAARVRQKVASDVELICLPDFYEEGFHPSYAPALRCQKPVFSRVEQLSGLSSRDLWGFDFKKWGYRMEKDSFLEVCAGAEWHVTTCQFDSRRVHQPLQQCARSIRYGHVFHDLIPILMPDLVVGQLSHWFPSEYLHSIGRMSSLCLGNSRASAIDLERWLTAHSYGDVPVYAVPFPTRQSINNRSSADIKKKVGCKTERYLLLVGSTDPRKNTARAIQAFTRVLSIVPAFRQSVSLLIVGPRVWRTPDILAAHEQALAAGASVIDTGYLEDDELHKLVEGASGVLMPSRYEGFGVPIALAQAYDVPVVTCINSSLAEVSMAAGAYATPRSVDEIAMAVSEILTCDRLARQCSLQNLEIESQTWDSYILQILDLALGSQSGTLQSPARKNAGAPRWSERQNPSDIRNTSERRFMFDDASLEDSVSKLPGHFSQEAR